MFGLWIIYVHLYPCKEVIENWLFKKGTNEKGYVIKRSSRNWNLRMLYYFILHNHPKPWTVFRRYHQKCLRLKCIFVSFIHKYKTTFTVNDILSFNYLTGAPTHQEKGRRRYNAVMFDLINSNYTVHGIRLETLIFLASINSRSWQKYPIFLTRLKNKRQAKSWQ